MYQIRDLISLVYGSECAKLIWLITTYELMLMHQLVSNFGSLSNLHPVYMLYTRFSAAVSIIQRNYLETNQFHKQNLPRGPACTMAVDASKLCNHK